MIDGQGQACDRFNLAQPGCSWLSTSSPAHTTSTEFEDSDNDGVCVSLQRSPSSPEVQNTILNDPCEIQKILRLGNPLQALSVQILLEVSRYQSLLQDASNSVRRIQNMAAHHSPQVASTMPQNHWSTLTERTRKALLESIPQLKTLFDDYKPLLETTIQSEYYQVTQSSSAVVITIEQRSQMGTSSG